MRFAAVGTDLSQFMSSPDFTGLAKSMVASKSMERNAANQANGLVAMTGLDNIAKVKSAGYRGDAIRSQGAAQGQAAIASGIGSMFSGIAGGFAYRGGGSGASKYGMDFVGSQGNPNPSVAPYGGGRMPLNG